MRQHTGAAAILVLLAGCFSTAVASSTPEELAGWIEANWAAQDRAYDARGIRPEVVRAVAGTVGSEGRPMLQRLDALEAASVPVSDARWRAVYLDACRVRRNQRLAPHLPMLRQIVFTKHFDMGGSHYAYTEAQSDAQAERNFRPGSALCILEVKDADSAPAVQTLIEDGQGVIRDPDVSFDGKRILFAWKKSDLEDDYHLYDMDGAGRVRQLTSGLGFADYEGRYLPSGDIIFNSTRCVQIVDCWWTEVSNLYTCNADGKFLRRLTYDQVHTNFPAVLPDGRVLYTRWDYNDRGQIFPQGLFQMYPDGTGQTEYYGNNSWFPTTLLHARGIPGTEKIVAIFTGHHTLQNGQLGIVDPAQGRQENHGAQLIAPVRKTRAVRVDAYGQDGDQFQYPYPLSEAEFVVGIRPAPPAHPGPIAPAPHFGIYYVNANGDRELLVADGEISCNQPVPMIARPVPPVRPSSVDYRKRSGAYYIHDIYAGPGLAGVPRGTIQRLRVVALDFRAAGVGENGSAGPGGDALASTPVSIGNGCWDPKIVLGDAPVYADGSAYFTVPAQTPVYFQAIDAKGRAVQTMRSWSTLQPGETFSCVGCHESKNAAPAVTPVTLAGKAGAQPPRPFFGPPRGFSFAREIQPILDRHCISCHMDPNQKMGDKSPDPRRSFSLLGTEVLDVRAQRRWSLSYLALTSSRSRQEDGAYIGKPSRLVNWIGVQSVPSMLPPWFGGSAKSELLPLLEKGHGEVRLSQEEIEKIACWIDLLVPFCGDYFEANAWSASEMKKYQRYLKKRLEMESIIQRNIAELIGESPAPSPH